MSPLRLTGLTELRAQLARLGPDETARRLAAAAELLRDAVLAGLAEGDALRGGVGVRVEGGAAAVGSRDAAAVARETGTVRRAPEPFLAPAAASAGEAVAEVFRPRRE